MQPLFTCVSIMIESRWHEMYERAALNHSLKSVVYDPEHSFQVDWFVDIILGTGFKSLPCMSVHRVFARYDYFDRRVNVTKPRKQRPRLFCGQGLLCLGALLLGTEFAFLFFARCIKSIIKKPNLTSPKSH